MSKLNLNELAALQMTLEFIPLKDVLISAMNYMAESENVRDKDNADIIYKATATFLR